MNTIFLNNFRPMGDLPLIEGYRLTAKLKENETRLFEQAPLIRLRVAKDVRGNFVLYPINVDVKIKVEQFSGWYLGWELWG